MSMARVIGLAPTPEELAAAPIVQLWEVRAMPSEEFLDRQLLFGFMVDHPHVEAQVFISSLPVSEIDTASSPTWARCNDRLYRLGQSKAAYSKRFER